MSILRQTQAFTCQPGKRPGTVRITARDKKSRPLSRTVKTKTWQELSTYSDNTFDTSCCWELGIGAFTA